MHCATTAKQKKINFFPSCVYSILVTRYNTVQYSAIVHSTENYMRLQHVYSNIYKYMHVYSIHIEYVCNGHRKLFYNLSIKLEIRRKKHSSDIQFQFESVCILFWFLDFMPTNSHRHWNTKIPNVDAYTKISWINCAMENYALWSFHILKAEPAHPRVRALTHFCKYIQRGKTMMQIKCE